MPIGESVWPLFKAYAESTPSSGYNSRGLRSVDVQPPFRRRRQKNNSTRARIMNAMPAATPIPALAPVDSPLLARKVDDEDVVVEDIAAVAVAVGEYSVSHEVLITVKLGVMNELVELVVSVSREDPERSAAVLVIVAGEIVVKDMAGICEVVDTDVADDAAESVDVVNGSLLQMNVLRILDACSGQCSPRATSGSISGVGTSQVAQMLPAYQPGNAFAPS